MKTLDKVLNGAVVLLLGLTIIWASSWLYRDIKYRSANPCVSTTSLCNSSPEYLGIGDLEAFSLLGNPVCACNHGNQRIFFNVRSR